MANKIRTWTEEELRGYNLIDVRPRPIAGKDIVEVFCNTCDMVGSSPLKNLISRKLTYGRKWACHACLKIENSNRGKKLTGSNNPFFNKKHTEDTKERMKISSELRWAGTSTEQRKEGLAKAIKKSLSLYGNINKNPLILKRIKDGQGLFFKNKEKVLKRSKKTLETNLKKYNARMFLHSEHYTPTNDRFASKPEKEILQFVKTLGLDAKKRRQGGVEVDIYIDSIKIGIEHNGLFHHSEARKHKNYHLEKMQYCKKNGIRLIQVFGHEWLDKKYQVSSYLRSALGGNTQKIHARKCAIQIIEKTEAIDFIEKYHIQGSQKKALLFIGIYFLDQLIAVGSFGKHHRDGQRWVMSRFVSKEDFTVVGGLSRISKYASKILKEDIISWSDRRWSEGSGYIKAGWSVEQILPPDYFYIKHGRFFCNKQARKKKLVNTPKGMTEHEHALLDGLLRVYDCGKIRLVYKYAP